MGACLLEVMSVFGYLVEDVAELRSETEIVCDSDS